MNMSSTITLNNGVEMPMFGLGDVFCLFEGFLILERKYLGVTGRRTVADPEIGHGKA